MKRVKEVIIFRMFFIIICAYGLYLAIFDTSMDKFMGNGTSLNFYTIQSNIWVLLLEIILLIDAITKMIRKKDVTINRFLFITKYVITVGISLTFIVFWCMLAPFLGFKYALTLSNIFVHTLTPILMFADYFYFDKEIILQKKNIILTIIPPLYYLIFALIRAEISTTTLTGGSRYPYWFIDLDAYRVAWK